LVQAKKIPRVIFFTYGDVGLGTITSDSYGSCFGAFLIPSMTYLATGSIEFVICDSLNLNSGTSAITTQASKSFTTAIPPAITTKLAMATINENVSVIAELIKPSEVAPLRMNPKP
jgi:hypothetical protein